MHRDAPERENDPLGEDERPAVEVLVVDDQEVFRKVLRDLVAATPGMALAGEADSGEAAVDAVEALSPRMVIMDKRMPGMGGVEATRAITARNPELVVLLVSVEVPEFTLMNACGAHAFLRKQHLTPHALAEVWREHGAR
jgi:DNA-binding NarL/FixJ family response regulator